MCWLATLPAEVRGGRVLARTYEQAAARAHVRIKRLALLFADGDLDREGYELGRGQAQADLAAAEDELAKLRAAAPATRLPTLEQALRQAGGWHTALISGDVERQRALLAALVERVTPERTGRGTYGAIIAWTTAGEHLHTLVGAAKGGEQAA